MKHYEKDCQNKTVDFGHKHGGGVSKSYDCFVHEENVDNFGHLLL